MVVGRAALSVDRFAIAPHDDIHLAVVGHGLQGPVDGGEPDAVTALPHDVVDLLRRPELALCLERLGNGGPLSRLPARGCLSHGDAPRRGADAAGVAVARDRR